MGCAVSKKARCIRQRHAEEKKLNQYWYDREEHLITVHEPSSVVDPSDLRTDLLHVTKDQEVLLLVGMATMEVTSGGSPQCKMSCKAAKVLLDLDSIRRDSGIDVDSCTGEEEEEQEDLSLSGEIHGQC